MNIRNELIATHVEIAKSFGCASIGIGKQFRQESGLSNAELEEMLGPLMDHLIDGGANILRLDMPDGRKLWVYARRQGTQFDFGMRKDMEEIGWQDIADYLDKTVSPKNR